MLNLCYIFHIVAPNTTFQDTKNAAHPCGLGRAALTVRNIFPVSVAS